MHARHRKWERDVRCIQRHTLICVKIQERHGSGCQERKVEDTHTRALSLHSLCLLTQGKNKMKEWTCASSWDTLTTYIRSRQKRFACVNTTVILINTQPRERVEGAALSESQLSEGMRARTRSPQTMRRHARTQKERGRSAE